ncbi:TPA: hypothetical protein ACX96U_001599 [Clostridium sporogenes]
MFFYKLKNFFNNFNQPDYKRLDVSKNISASQYYGKTIAIMANTEDIKSNGDLEQITEEEYLKLKSEIEEENKKDTPQSVDIEKETFTQTLAELTIENKKKDSMIANLAETVANLTIQVNKLKGSVQ